MEISNKNSKMTNTPKDINYKSEFEFKELLNNREFHIDDKIFKLKVNIIAGKIDMRVQTKQNKALQQIEFGQVEYYADGWRMVEVYRGGERIGTLERFLGWKGIWKSRSPIGGRQLKGRLGYLKQEIISMG